MKKMVKMLAVLLLSAVCLCGCTNEEAENSNTQGLASFNAGNYETAVEYFDQAIAASPKTASYYVNLGMAKLELEEYSESQDAFLTAISLDSRNAYAYRGLGVLYFKTGYYAEAASALTTALEKTSSSGVLALDIMEYRGEAQLLSGDYSGAIENYQTMIRSGGDSGVVEYLLGRAYLYSGNEAEASACFVQMTKDADLKKTYYISAYQECVSAGCENRGKEILDILLENTDKDTLTVCLRGQAAYLEKNYERAIQEYESIRSSLGDDDLKYLALCYAKSDRGDEALAIYEELEKSEPDNAAIDREIALYYMNMEDYQTALSYIEKGLTKADGDSDTERLLSYEEAVCHEYLGDYEEALTLFENYVKTWGDDEEADHEIEFLKRCVE